MSVLAGLVLVIQFSFAYHALKNGRPYWWVFLIMIFPVAGWVIYSLLKVSSSAHQHRATRHTACKRGNALLPDAELKSRAKELEICGSIGNKRALARECSAHQMHAEAIILYESCLQGAFANDGNTLFHLAQAALEGGYWDKAEVAIARLKADTPDTHPQEVRLLEARLLEERGDIDAALTVYRELVPLFIGLEARYRYGDLLMRLGQHEAAKHMFEDVLKQAERFAPATQEEEQWVRAARRAMAHAG